MSLFFKSRPTIFKFQNIITIILIVGFYFLIRLVNLTIIPIFTDEAIYLRWGQIALADPRWRFISLIDGKQPLLIWLFLPFLKYITDPLIAGRLVSVISGCMGMLGMVSFIWYLTKKFHLGIIGGLGYILLPFFLVYDRLAIYDSLLTTITIWALFFSYLLGKTLKLSVALILGNIIGLGLLTKSSAEFFLMLLPTTLLLINWQTKRNSQIFFRWLGCLFAVWAQSQVYVNILRLSEFRHVIVQKNLSFIYSFSEFIQHPFISFFGNLRGLSDWLITYLTWPMVLALILAIVCQWNNHRKETIFFLSWFAFPFFSLAFFGRVIYPRFLLFMVPPLLVLMVSCLSYIGQLYQKLPRTLFWFGSLVLLGPIFYFDIKLLFNPIHAPLPYADRQQYINDWPAGYGIAEVIKFIDQESKNGQVIVGTEGTFGLFPMALELYLGKNEQVTFKAYWPVNEVPKDLRQDAGRYATYLVFKEKQEIPSDWRLQLIAQYQRGDGPTYLKFYRVLP